MLRGISPIVVKRLRSSLRSRRALLCTLVVALFAVVVSWVSVQQYREQKELFEAERLAYRLELDSPGLRTYSQVRMVVGKEPSPLGIVAEGIGDRFGSTAILRGKYGRPKLEQRAGENFLRTTETVDFVRLGGVLLTLTALLVTFDVIVGETSRGTMELVRSNAVSWRQILAGEYLAALLTLLPATVIVFAIVGIAMDTAGAVEPSQEDWLGLALQWGFTTLLVGAFSAVGILSSTLGRSEGAALVVAFGFWVLLVAIYPDATSWLVRLSEASRTEAPTEVTFSQSALLVELEPRVEAERWASPAERDPLELPEECWRLRNRLRWTGPFTSYALGSSTIAGTDFRSSARFLEAVEDLDHRLEAWQRAKVAEHPDREKLWTWGAGRLDLAGLPAAEVEREDLAGRLGRAALPGASLLVWNLLPLALALARVKTRETC